MSEETATVESSGAESSGIDPGVAELTAFGLGESQPESTGTEAETQSDGQSAEQGQQREVGEQQAAPERERQPRKTKAEPAAPAQGQPAEQKFKVRGREYSAAEIMANPHLLEDLVQTYEQFPHLQKKHLEALQQMRQPAQPVPGQQQGPAPVTPEQILAHFGPEAAALGQQGYLEDEFTTVYPKVAANLVGYRKVIELASAKIDRLEAYLAQQNQFSAQATEQQQVARVVQELDSGIDHVASSAPTFEPLKDPAVRAQFRDFVVNQLNPEAKAIVGEPGRQFMERAAYAFFGPAIAQSIQQQASAARQNQAAQRRNAVGDAGGARPGAVKEDPWANELLTFAGVPERLATG